MNSNLQKIRATRSKKTEKPRPLRALNINVETNNTTFSQEEFCAEIDVFLKNVANTNDEELFLPSLVKICNQLKSFGHHLESSCKENLDKYFISLRNVAKLDKLDRLSRLRLLEVIELRAMGWAVSENLTGYYKCKAAEIDVCENGDDAHSTISSSSSNNSNAVAITQVIPSTSPSPGPPPSPSLIRSSGKYAKPFKIPGKDYFKDEIIIRGADSGKVMGIKGRRIRVIEELSDTIISFQRANQGAKERTVQITGPSEDNIIQAKSLIEDTIKRNASPVRASRLGSTSSLCSDDGRKAAMGSRNASTNSLASEDPCDIPVDSENIHRCSLVIRDTTLRLACGRADILKVARQVLEQHFSLDGDNVKTPTNEEKSHWKIGGASVHKNRPASQQSSECGDEEPGSHGDTEQMNPTQEFCRKRSISDDHPAIKASGDRNFNSKHQEIEKKLKKYSPSGINNRSRSYTSPELHVETTDVSFAQGLTTVTNSTVLSPSSPMKMNQPRTSPLLLRKSCFPVRQKSSSSVLDHPAAHLDLAYGYQTAYPQQMVVIRQPLFPNSTPKAFHVAEKSGASSQTSGKGRRAQFAKKVNEQRTNRNSAPPDISNAVDLTCNNSNGQLSEATVIKEGSTCTSNNIVYSRDFLLMCSASPFCRVTPRELPRLARDVPLIVRKDIEAFDAESYRKQLETNPPFSCLPSLPSTLTPDDGNARKSCAF